MTDRISSKLSRTDWLILRENLKDKGQPYKEWFDAISLLQERVNERYFNPLQILIDYEKSYTGAGFTIATIECSLIEFIAALTEGRLFKKTLDAGDNPHRYYTDSAIVYSRFLRTSTVFSTYFSSPTNNPTFRPDDFYKNVRCALVHEAQTKKDWEIRIFGKTKTNDKKNRIIFDIENSTGKKLLFRTALFYCLKDYFNNYCEIELVQNSNRGRTLRKFLARKIDYILEVKPDLKYWWT